MKGEIVSVTTQMMLMILSLGYAFQVDLQVLFSRVVCHGTGEG